MSDKWFRISWWHDLSDNERPLGPFVLLHPRRLVSVRKDGEGLQRLIEAIVPAENEDAAKEIILSAYETRPEAIEWGPCKEHDTYGFPRL